MKKYLFLLPVLLVAACQTDSPADEDVQVVSQQVTTHRLGTQQVYGVSFKATSASTGYQRFAVELARGADVWLDTLGLDLAAGDTVESEVIFSDAPAEEGAHTQLKVYPVASK